MPAEVRIEHSYPAAWAFVQEHGPEAIAVLHDLLARAVVDGDRLIVVASVRQVAERLGFLSKDTVHRRVRQLQRAGVLHRLVLDPSSRFACPRYVIDVSGTGIALLMSSAVEPD
jgi:DNA-binding Lrp family transcriptional regulator